MSASGSSRRRFLRTAVIAGLASALPAEALAQGRTRPATKPAPAPRPVPPAAGATPPSEEARAIAAILRRRHAHLDDAKIAGITRELDQRLDAGRRLRAVKLPNSAEPDTTFRA